MRRVWFLFAPIILFCLAQSNQCDAAAYAFVVNSGDDTVSVISRKNRKPKNTWKTTWEEETGLHIHIAVQTAPVGVAFSPDGDYVYVASWDNTEQVGTVSIIETSEVVDAKVLEDKAVQVGSEPVGVAVSPNGKFICVTNRGDNELSVISRDNTNYPPTWEEKLRIPVGTAPVGVAVSPDGKYIYVANCEDGRVSVIDFSEIHEKTPETAVVASPLVGEYPVGVAVSPDGTYIYVTNFNGNSVSVIFKDTTKDPTTWKEATSYVTRIEVGAAPFGVAVSPNGRFVYVTNRDGNSVSVIDTSKGEFGEVVDTVSVGTTPIGVAFTPNGDYALVTNSGDGTVSVIKTSNPERKPYPVEDVGNGPASFGQFVGSVLKPNKPINLPAKVESTQPDTQINLSWIDLSSDELAFSIRRKIGSDGACEGGYSYESLDEVDKNVTKYSDTGLDEGLDELTTYCYRVVAVNDNGSTRSNEASDTTYLIAPSELSATAGSAGEIDLYWDDNSDKESWYRIETTPAIDGDCEFPENYCDGPDENGNCYLVDSNTTTFSHTGLIEAVRHCYRVVALNKDKVASSSYSNESAATSVFPAPSELSAAAVSGGQIDLSWDINSESQEGFEIERKIGSDATFTRLVDVEIGANDISYSDTDQDESTTYYYRIRAFYDSGDNRVYSGFSNVASATTSLSAPSDLSARAVSDSEIDLSWTKNSTDESGFRIERMTVSDQTGSGGSYTEIATVDADVTSCRDSNLKPYTTYRYRVTAYNDEGDSDYSNEAKARTKDDSICFISTAAYGSLLEPQSATLRNSGDDCLIPNALFGPILTLTIIVSFMILPWVFLSFFQSRNRTRKIAGSSA